LLGRRYRADRILFGLPIHTAIGTSLAVDVIVSIIVSIAYLRMGNVELRSGLGLALGAVVGAQVGSRIAKYIPSANLGRGLRHLLSHHWGRKTKRKRTNRATKFPALPPKHGHQEGLGPK
jgi:uncharacterized membrane protein YfcA